MMTLISWQTSGGDQGRCDAKCYEAKEEDCTCICGGRNHGAGLDQALDNTREMAQSWIEHAGQDISDFKLGADVASEPLF